MGNIRGKTASPPRWETAPAVSPARCRTAPRSPIQGLELDPRRVSLSLSLFPSVSYQALTLVIRKDGNGSRVCSVLGLRHLKRGRYLGDGLRSVTRGVTGDDVRPVCVV